ncbi:MAG: OmpH family outer membrane protein [Bacteroidales bacterium]|nr:OmpH family outer membrane protein [Bacteroidales bacterium]
MKKTIIFAAFAVIVAGIVASCTNGQTTGANASASPVANYEGGKLPIAYVNMDSVFANYDFSKDMSEELTRKAENLRANLNSKKLAFEKEAQEFQKKVQTNAFLSQQRMESEGNRLAQKQQSIEQEEYKLSNDFAQEQLLKNQQVLDTILVVIKQFNETKKYDMIINDVLLIENPDYNITNEVIEVLNTRYAKTKK